MTTAGKVRPSQVDGLQTRPWGGSDGQVKHQPGRVADGVKSRCRVPTVPQPVQYQAERTQVADRFGARARHDLQHAGRTGAVSDPECGS
jgi:hypothetical protein